MILCQKMALLPVFCGLWHTMREESHSASGEANSARRGWLMPVPSQVGKRGAPTPPRLGAGGRSRKTEAKGEFEGRACQKRGRRRKALRELFPTQEREIKEIDSGSQRVASNKTPVGAPADSYKVKKKSGLKNCERSHCLGVGCLSQEAAPPQREDVICSRAGAQQLFPIF